MKRSREDESPLRRSVSSRGDPMGQANFGATTMSYGNQKLTTKDALTYLKDVKDIFHDNKEKYNDFLEAMKDFKAQRIDTSGVIERVKELFKGHQHLIIRFNTFLPEGYEIDLKQLPVVQEEKRPVEFKEAIHFVNKIKARFENDEQVYKSFLNILNMYRKGSKSIHEVYEEVSILFHRHQDLLDEFTHFLPDTSTAVHAFHPSSGRPFGTRDDRSSAKSALRHAHIDKRDRNYTSNIDQMDLEHGKQKQSADIEKDRKEDRRVHDRSGKELEHGRRELDNVPCKRKAPHKDDDPSGNQLLQCWNDSENFGVYLNSASSIEDKKNTLKGVYTEEFNFCEKVKEKLNPESYSEFLGFLHIYSKEIISRVELKDMVGDVLGKYPHLMEGFNDFLAHCENNRNIDGFLAGVICKKNMHWPCKIEDRHKEWVHVKDEREKVHGRDREKEKDRVEKPTHSVFKDSSGHKSSDNKDKQNFFKPISELDLSLCEQCTPSYRLLPNNYPTPSSSHRTKIGASVLNDNWVSVTSGSEDYSFKHMRKNQYEESLFRCEDDRFELDMLLERANLTTKRVEEILEKMQDFPVKQESQFHIEDHLTALNMRCIERLYGDHGLDMLDILHKNAFIALPVILTRLKQKQEEWYKCRSDFNKVWVEIYAKNYHKSLDHRSFYFKQQDRKNLSTKALLAEINEINEKNWREDDTLLAIAAGNRSPLIPSIEFEYGDFDIHEDLYQIMKYSCGEVFSSEDQADKIIRVWTTFLESMLGIPSRPNCSEDPEPDVKIRNHIRKSSITTIVETGRSSGSDSAVCNTKQSNAGSNRDENIPVDETNLCRTRLANGDATVKEEFQNVDQFARQNYNAFNFPSHDKAQSIQSPCRESSNNNCSILLEPIHGSNTTPSKYALSRSEAPVEQKLHNDNLPTSVGDGHAKTIITESSKNHISYDGTGHRNFKVEREEGELSPIGDFEEDNFVGFEESARDVSMPNKARDGSSNITYPLIAEEVPVKRNGTSGENDDEGDESAHRSIGDSENASEAVEDVSGSEMDEGEECSREDNDEDADHDNKAESEAEGMVDVHDAEGEETSIPFSEHFLHTAKPLAKHVASAVHDKETKVSHIFYGNDSFYVLLRLHQILYERILSAKINSQSSERKWRTVKDTYSTNLYAKFMSALYSLLNGSIDNTKFEDECRTIIGTQSYVLFTMDKLIYKIVKQLQVVSSDEVGNKLLQLYAYEKSRRPERYVDLVYHENARALHDGNIYRFEFCPCPTRLSIQLMDSGCEKSEGSSVSMDPSFAAYLNNDFLSINNEKTVPGVFLRRIKEKRQAPDQHSSSSNKTKGVHILNGLECKISWNSSKVSYVLDTEDILYRRRVKRRKCSKKYYEKKEQKFQEFQSDRVGTV